MPKPFKTSPAGRAFLESNEGLLLVAKPDAKGKWSIGYGHDLLPGESYPNGITAVEADQILSEDLAKEEAAVNAGVPDNCTQNQFDALVDFTHEEGPGGLHQLLAHGWDKIPVQILRWDVVEGKHNAGVAERRKKDLALFQQA